MSTPPDKTRYRDELIARGIDPAQADGIARRTAGKAPAAPEPTQQATLFDAPAAPAPVRRRRTEAGPGVKDSVLLMASASPSEADIAYLHAIMCQVGLPRSARAVAGKTVFDRECGGAALSISAGKLWDGQRFVQQPIPYGANPRLVLAWLNTQAVKTRSPVISVGDSVTEFMRLLGKESTGGRNGSLTSFKKQVQALAACRITLGFNANGRAYTYNGQPVRQFEAWIGGDPEQRALWPGILTFSDDYFETLINHAVPQDVRAMYALKGSALAMDIYAMLAERLHRISGRPVTLPWHTLREQFGQEYQGKDPDKDFKKAFLLALANVLAVYPKAKVSTVDGGLQLSPSPPPIPYKR